MILSTSPKKRMTETAPAGQARETRLGVRVYIEDTDAGGIVYYVNYLKFMERARSEFLRELGCGKAALFADKLMFVVHSIQVDYHTSAELDDELTVTARVQKAGKVSAVFEQNVYRDGQLLCGGTVKVACVDCDTRQPVAIPAELAERLR